jgi:uncharacterized protein (TIGR03435 family)
MTKPMPMLWKTIVLTACGIAPIVAQTPAPAPVQPQFEVASIKPNKSSDGRVSISVQPGGRFMATNVPVRMLIRNAYQLQEFQMVGGPDWIGEDRFDINAKAEADGTVNPFRPDKPGEPSKGQLMLRALLAERFKLAVHNEDREMPIYALVLARSDGKLGPQLTKSTVDCGAGGPGGGRTGGPGGPGASGGGPDGPGAQGAGGTRVRVGGGVAGTPQAPPAPGAGGPGPGNCGIRIAPGNMSVSGSPMSQFAGSLAMWVGRIVVDKTGLAGGYDFNLTWTPDQMPPRPGVPGGPEPPPIDPNGPSIFTAVQEQLGLKLDSQRGPVSVLVIDHVEHPVVD